MIRAGVTSGEIQCGEMTTYLYRRTRHGFEFVRERWRIVE